jgi:cytochrome bd-type quinol oxidase subunit 2
MSYTYWVLLHLLGVLGLLGTHGVSTFVMYRLRKVAPDRDKITELIGFSASTVIPMYISLGVLLIGGVGAAIKVHYLSQPWILISIGILVVILIGMYALARPYFRRMTAACGIRPSGVPRASDEELIELARSPRAHVISAIGGGGLLVIVFMMVTKPFGP